MPNAGVEIVESHNREWDFEARVNTGAGERTLVCQAKSRAWPNELHAIAYRMHRAIEQLGNGRLIPVLVAPYVSPQAAESCRELGLSWADLAGNCELHIDEAFIHVQGLPNPFRKGRGTASLYSPKSSRVVHALLIDPKRPWTTEDLAMASGVSLGQVASVKKLLATNRWIRASYGHTVLTEPRKLLADWSNHYKPKRSTVHLFTLDAPAVLEERIASTVPDYAFTEFSAADRYAPYTRYQRVAFYVPGWDEQLSNALDLKSGDGASNVTVYVTGAPIPHVEEAAHARCVSPVLVYLDLLQLPGRGQDAAEHLLASAIEPRWR
ncbi:MAG: type IV toxin-antitoxin system AbiEi family antitoxin [Fimbriimonadaceae bacterium]|nr:hypothetical protein [Chthonomonadaceae bacterium]MCO5298035.1 type IV toxin-antitoxin system AbiEi family antitoxin [Fimbriimonadaceae bacterium]